MSPGRTAAIAAGFLLVFVAIALAAVGGLVYAGIELIHHVERTGDRGVVIAGPLILACFGAAAVILWSLLPRRDRFEAPGPELARADAPALFREIEELATAVGQPPPAHIYLTSEVNLSVAQRGGVLGIGSRRVMTVGLPLLQLLAVSELRAGLAHEFGHYHAGDTRLGPWLYHASGAVARTAANLSVARAGAAETEARYITWILTAVLTIVLKPFEWYELIFLRVTQSVRRAQERTADRLAAEVAGSAPLASGLKKIGAGRVGILLAFMDDHVLPRSRWGSCRRWRRIRAVRRGARRSTRPWRASRRHPSRRRGCIRTIPTRPCASEVRAAEELACPNEDGRCPARHRSSSPTSSPLEGQVGSLYRRARRRWAAATAGMGPGAGEEILVTGMAGSRRANSPIPLAGHTPLDLPACARATCAFSCGAAIDRYADRRVDRRRTCATGSSRPSAHGSGWR
jgi:Zn-dependent protease with chaperone function